MEERPVSDYICPECGEPATSDNLHLDGTPLCPVIGAVGYEPAHAVAVDSPQGQEVRTGLLDALGADAALDVLRNGTSEQRAIALALGSAGAYGLDPIEIEPAVRSTFREHLAGFRGRQPKSEATTGDTA